MFKIILDNELRKENELKWGTDYVIERNDSLTFNDNLCKVRFIDVDTGDSEVLSIADLKYLVLRYNISFVNISIWQDIVTLYYDCTKPSEYFGNIFYENCFNMNSDCKFLGKNNYYICDVNNSEPKLCFDGKILLTFNWMHTQPICMSKDYKCLYFLNIDSSKYTLYKFRYDKLVCKETINSSGILTLSNIFGSVKFKLLFNKFSRV